MLITADGGGSNGYRLRLWKLELQKLADATQLAIEVCLSLLFNPSRCVEELRPFVKRLDHGSEEHPAWTSVFRVECQTHGVGKPR